MSAYVCRLGGYRSSVVNRAYLLVELSFKHFLLGHFKKAVGNRKKNSAYKQHAQKRYKAFENVALKKLFCGHLFALLMLFLSDISEGSSYQIFVYKRGYEVH